jgi:hypothetical protein
LGLHGQSKCSRGPPVYVSWFSLFSPSASDAAMVSCGGVGVSSYCQRPPTRGRQSFITGRPGSRAPSEPPSSGMTAALTIFSDNCGAARAPNARHGALMPVFPRNFVPCNMRLRPGPEVYAQHEYNVPRPSITSSEP